MATWQRHGVSGPMSETVFFVDDDAGLRDVYRQLLEQEGYRFQEAGDATQARQRFASTDARLVVLDLMLPPSGRPEEGVKLCEEMLSARPSAKVIVISGTGETELPLSVIRRGAYDFIQKPVDPDVLSNVIGRAAARLALEDHVEQLRETLTSAELSEGGPLGSSQAMTEAKVLAERVGPTEVPVLIAGETGTGKEVFARLVHDKSLRSKKPFVPVNCGALPAGVLESTLFGHEKGAFTGAVSAAKGLFAEADGGTLFLDELGDMDPALQVKLLRVLETGDVLPVGASKAKQVDVRLVSATHRDLEQRVTEGSFREDLYYRVRGVELTLPPLRERAGDVALLAQHFLNRARRLVPGAAAASLSPEALRALEAYPWPGNLRELRNEMQRALVMCAGREEVLEADLSPRVTAGDREKTDSSAATSLEQKISALERREIRAALQATNDNRSQTAVRLGLSRQGLLNKMARHGID